MLFGQAPAAKQLLIRWSKSAHSPSPVWVPFRTLPAPAKIRAVTPSTQNPLHHPGLAWACGSRWERYVLAPLASRAPGGAGRPEGSALFCLVFLAVHRLLGVPPPLHSQTRSTHCQPWENPADCASLQKRRLPARGSLSLPGTQCSDFANIWEFAPEDNTGYVRIW